MSPDTSADPATLLALALDVATRAGDFLLAGQHQPREAVETKATATDLVSEMDRNAEAMVVAGILAARPGDGLIGEEGANRPSESGISWVIDPLDGTVNYLFGWPVWAVSVAAEDAHGAVAGVVFVPALNETFTATRGGGAFLNDHPLTASTQTDLGLALLATGFSYHAELRREQARVVTQVLPYVRDLRRAGAAAVDLCWLAAGRTDGYYEEGTHVWDRAAGLLCLHEAGGVSSDGRGGPASDPLCVASAPAIHDQLCALITSADRD